MASTYSNLLRIELLATGENRGTWGTKTNSNLSNIVEQAIAGISTVLMLFDADYTLTTNCTLTMPSPASYPGRILYVKNITANTVASSQTNISPLTGGANTTSILAATAGKFAMLQSDGVSWVTMMSN